MQTGEDAAACIEPTLPEQNASTANAGIEEDSGTRQNTPKLLTGEPILPPSSSTYLPEATLISTSQVTRISQQLPESAGSSTENLLVLPNTWKYAVAAKLIDDPMLDAA